MNREILFKAKRKDNSEWIEGYLLKFEDYIFDYSERIDIPYIIPIDNFNLKNIKQYEVIPETVCQYAGLKDKNGVKLFENDIVKARYEENNGYIKWNSGNASFQIKGIPSHTLKRADELEAIGNIFDEEVK